MNLEINSNTTFELRAIVGLQILNGTKLNGFVYARHGAHFPLCWIQSRTDPISTQSEIPSFLPMNCNYNLVYVRNVDIPMEKLLMDFLNYLGDQNHIKCVICHLTLIA